MEHSINCPRCRERLATQARGRFHATLIEARYIILECTTCGEQLMFSVQLPQVQDFEDIVYTIAHEA